jgi:hypothetical protein
MPKFVSTKNLMLLGVLLFGVTLSTVAVSQPIPPEVSLKATAAYGKAESVDHSIDAISLRCDKCDALVKKEIAAAKKEVAGLKKALDDLSEITNSKFVAIGKACLPAAK